jgi:hypothetical protein
VVIGKSPPRSRNASPATPRHVSDLAKQTWVGFAAPLDRLPAQRWLQAHVGHQPHIAAFVDLLRDELELGLPHRAESVLADPSAPRLASGRTATAAPECAAAVPD